MEEFMTTVTQEKSGRLLIVDDDPTARLVLAAMVQECGVQVAFACDGGDAKRRMDAVNPDVVICDFMMSDMRGDELSRWMKAHEKWRYVPVVAVTQLDNPILCADLMASGADSVVTKADAPQMLSAHVLAALRLRRQYAMLAAEGGQSNSDQPGALD